MPNRMASLGDCKMKWIAAVLLALGGLMCGLNFYLSFLRYPIHRLAGGTKDNYKWVSGAPVFGSVFVALSLVVFWDTPWILVTAVVLILIDTGGLHWFAAAMLYQTLRKEK